MTRAPWRLLAIGGVVCLSFLARPATPARAGDDVFASEAARGAHSSARLLAGGERGGVYRAGVEIRLDPETITYWRQPGDAGAPPVFDFSASENVASAEALYPAPKRLVEAGVEVAGYDGDVVFPVRVTPKDPRAPVILRLTLDYAACRAICTPSKAKLALALPRAKSPFDAALDAAEALVPRRLSESEAKSAAAVSRLGDGAWRLRYLGPGRAEDVFVEAPEPYFIDSGRNADGSFDLKLASSCCAAAAERPSSLSVRVTIRADRGSVELSLPLE